MDKALYFIASGIFFGISMYLFINFEPTGWLSLWNYFMFLTGTMTMGWIAFWRAY
jgi:hypothetical protein